MLNRILCCLMVFLFVCPILSFAEDCEHLHVYTYYDDHHYVRPDVFDVLGHTYVYTEYRLCYDCNTIVYTKVHEEAQFHSHSFSHYTNKTYGHDSSYHWEIGDEVLSCGCGHTKSGDTSIQYLYAAHYASGSVWYDAGHSGTVHYYDAVCAHSTCSARFRWRTISCPGGDHHIAPNSIVKPPVVTE